jgi:acetyl esterase/lipase
MMLIVNSRDELIPVSQARRMGDRLSAVGVPHRLRLLDGSAHALEYAARAIQRTTTFLRRSLRGRGAGRART